MNTKDEDADHGDSDPATYGIRSTSFGVDLISRDHSARREVTFRLDQFTDRLYTNEGALLTCVNQQ